MVKTRAGPNSLGSEQRGLDATRGILSGATLRSGPKIPLNRTRGLLRRFSAGAVYNLQIGGALTRIIYSGVLLSKF